MSRGFTATARKLGLVAAAGVVTIITVYGLVLVAGFLSLESPEQPIGEPYFTLLELLILLLMPFLVALFAALHAWAADELKVFSVLALVFAGMVAVVTCSVHFTILAVSSHPVFAEFDLATVLFSFRWPSIAYALDILAWDLFFAMAVLFAAPLFRGGGLARAIRVLLIVSGVLALAGLGGVVTGDMRLRNIGIAGYTVVFAGAALLVAVLFYRSPAE